VELADDLRAVRGIDAVERVASLDAFPADHQRILAAEFALNFVERRPHSLRIFFLAEISKRFVTKFCCHGFSLCTSVKPLCLGGESRSRVINHRDTEISQRITEL